METASVGWKDKALFTPGPLTTSRSVKYAMLRDMGARDSEFLRVVNDIEEELLNIAQVSAEAYAVVLLQGCGTYGVEAVFTNAIPGNGKVLILANGAYGVRMRTICERANIDHRVIQFPDDHPILPESVEQALNSDPSFTHVAVVHLETTSGLINPITEIGAIAARHHKGYIVDAMCSFGAMPIDFDQAHIDWLVSSANKCLEGVPGFTYVIVRQTCLIASEGNARSLSFDLYDQWSYFRQVGQFRFTPPVQVLLAFHQALQELAIEGGVEGRATRYRNNHDTLVRGMRRIGFDAYVDPEYQGYCITTFLYPQDSRFDFTIFYNQLSWRGYDIYSGKVAEASCFRIGNIGCLFQEDIEALLVAIQCTLRNMGVTSLNLYPL